MRPIVIAASAAAALAATASAATAPTLKIVTRSPLVVAGAHFRSGERVTLHAGSSSFVVRASRAGTFRADLGAVAGDRCSVGIVAVGSHAERVVVPFRVRPLCAPARPGAAAESRG